METAAIHYREKLPKEEARLVALVAAAGLSDADFCSPVDSYRTTATRRAVEKLTAGPRPYDPERFNGNGQVLVADREAGPYYVAQVVRIPRPGETTEGRFTWLPPYIQFEGPLPDGFQVAFWMPHPTREDLRQRAEWAEGILDQS